jgi:hypothetical protein
MGFEMTLQDFERPKLDGLSRLAKRVYHINATEQNTSAEVASQLLHNPKFHRHVHETRTFNIILS